MASSVPTLRQSSDAPIVLVVEDQDDVRLMLMTVLQMEGYRVEEASNAIEGLDLLRRRKYGLVITDYAMPGGTGTWMLQRASEDGRLKDTCALVVTAHPELVRPSTGFTVVGKPIDLDVFLHQVRRILHQSDNMPPLPRRTRVKRARVELVLYVSGASPASVRAAASVERVLTMFNRADVAYSTCELRDNPETAAYDRVVFTPTLVKRHPSPRMWIVGDLKDGVVVADLLRTSGVAPVN